MGHWIGVFVLGQGFGLKQDRDTEMNVINGGLDMHVRPKNWGEPLGVRLSPSRILNGGRAVATTLGRLSTAPRRSVLVALMLSIILFAGGVSSTEAQTAEKEIGGLTLSSNSPGTLQVSWDVVTPTPTDHRVQWVKSNTGGKGKENAYPGSNSYPITGLEEGVSYNVRVRSRYFSIGKSPGPWSEWVTLVVASEPEQPVVETPVAAPHVPNLRSNHMGPRTVTLNWDVPAAPTGQTLREYRVYRNTSANGRGDYLGTIAHDASSTSSSVSFTDDDGPEPETTYYYYVNAVYTNQNGGTDVSEYNALTVETPVAAPHVPNLRSNHMGPRTVTLNWDVPAAPTGQTLREYRVYRNTSANGRGDYLGTIAHDASSTSSSVSFTDDDGPEPETTYYYYVNAVYTNQNGGTDVSEYNALTVETPVAAPHVPNLRSDHMGPRTVTLNWDVPAAPTGQTLREYRVYRNTSANGRGDYLGTISHDASSTSSSVSFTDDDGPEPETTYYYYVNAVYTNQNGGTDVSEYNALTVETPVAAPHVPNLRSNHMGPRTVTLSWDVPAAPTGQTLREYRVYRNTSANGRGDYLGTIAHDASSTSSSVSFTDDDGPSPKRPTTTT